MTLLVDTCVWSLALRRDSPADVPEVRELAAALAGPELVATTGLILQEVLQGAVPARVRVQIAGRFAALSDSSPERADHVTAADLRGTCRRAGVQLGTVDALIAALCVRRGLTLLTTDHDFRHAARHVALRVWSDRTG